MSKIIKVKSWKDIAAMPKKAVCPIQFKNGDIYEFDIIGLTQPRITEIMEHYEDKLPNKPVRMGKLKGDDKPRLIDITEGAEYESYKLAEKNIANLRGGVLAISFLPEEYRPEVDVKLTGYDKLEAQAIMLNNEVVGGALGKIIEYGMEVSGFGVKFDDQVEDAKNS